jgi:hypothetical protein
MPYSIYSPQEMVPKFIHGTNLWAPEYHWTFTDIWSIHTHPESTKIGAFTGYFIAGVLSYLIPFTICNSLFLCLPTQLGIPLFIAIESVILYEGLKFLFESSCQGFAVLL